MDAIKKSVVESFAWAVSRATSGFTACRDTAHEVSELRENSARMLQYHEQDLEELEAVVTEHKGRLQGLKGKAEGYTSFDTLAAAGTLYVKEETLVDPDAQGHMHCRCQEQVLLRKVDSPSEMGRFRKKQMFNEDGSLSQPLYPKMWYDTFVPSRWASMFYSRIDDRRLHYWAKKEELAEQIDDVNKQSADFVAQIHAVRFRRHKLRMRQRKALTVLMYAVIFAIPVVDHFRQGDFTRGSFRHGSHTETRMGMWCACILMAVTKVLFSDRKDLNGSGTERARSGYIEKGLAIFNFYMIPILVVKRMWLTYAGRFAGGAVEAAGVEGDGVVLFLRGADFQNATCEMFESPEAARAASGVFFHPINMALFMAGALALSLGEVLKLEPEQDFLFKGWVDITGLLQVNTALRQSGVFGAVERMKPKVEGVLGQAEKADSDLKELEAVREVQQYAASGRELLAQVPVEQAIHMTNLEKVSYPFVLQAFGIALWIPMDYVIPNPCLHLDKEVKTKLAFGLVDLPEGVAYLQIVQALALGAIAACVAMIVLGEVLRRLSSHCPSCLQGCSISFAGYVPVAIFFVLLVYDVLFGTYQEEASEFSQRRLFSVAAVASATASTGSTVLEFSSIAAQWVSASAEIFWVGANVVQVGVRGVIATASRLGKTIPGTEPTPQEKLQFKTQASTKMTAIIEDLALKTESPAIQKAVFKDSELTVIPVNWNFKINLEMPYDRRRDGVQQVYYIRPRTPETSGGSCWGSNRA